MKNETCKNPFFFIISNILQGFVNSFDLYVSFLASDKD